VASVTCSEPQFSIIRVGGRSLQLVLSQAEACLARIEAIDYNKKAPKDLA